MSPDGTEHWFDPSLLTEAPATERPAMYSDRRVLRGPLPAIARGAVVEVETRSTVTPWAHSGANFRIPLQNFYPTRKLTVRVEVPRDLPFHVTETGAQWAYTTREDVGTRVLTLEVPPTPALELDEPETPEDYPSIPYLWVSTAPDWHSAAAEYSAIVDQALKHTDLLDLARKVIGDTQDPRVAANRILTWMAPLRYASVGLGDTSVVPRPPAEVLRRQFGDCKDLSTLVVGLLRAAGFEAWTALLLTEFQDNIDAAPGLRQFDHVIVRVGGAQPFWLDATAFETHPAGSLPTGDQGRRVLVASATTTGLDGKASPGPVRHTRCDPRKTGV